MAVWTARIICFTVLMTSFSYDLEILKKIKDDTLTGALHRDAEKITFYAHPSANNYYLFRDWADGQTAVSFNFSFKNRVAKGRQSAIWASGVQ